MSSRNKTIKESEISDRRRKGDMILERVRIRERVRMRDKEREIE